MTQEEIRARREELDARRKEARRQMEHVQVDYRHLQLDCDHPNQYTYSAMGELGQKCPDCGWQT